MITISTGGCGTGWHQVHAGMHTFQLHDSDTGSAEVDLINPANGAVYAEAAGLGPGTTRPMRLNVGSGRYAFRCLIEDTDPITGPTVRGRRAHQRGAAGILPVTNNDLHTPGQRVPRLRHRRAEHAGQPGPGAGRRRPRGPPGRGQGGLAAAPT